MLARIASIGYNIVVTHIYRSLPKNDKRKEVLTSNTPSVIQVIRTNLCGPALRTAAPESLRAFATSEHEWLADSRVTSKYRKFVIQKKNISNL